MQRIKAFHLLAPPAAPGADHTPTFPAVVLSSHEGEGPPTSGDLTKIIMIAIVMILIIVIVIILK